MNTFLHTFQFYPYYVNLIIKSQLGLFQFQVVTLIVKHLRTGTQVLTKGMGKGLKGNIEQLVIQIKFLRKTLANELYQVVEV